MRALAFLLLLALPSLAAAQTADYARLIENRLSAYERELRALNNTVERLRRQVEGLELRIEGLERAAAAAAAPAAPSGPPAADAQGAAVPPAAAIDASGAETGGTTLPGGDALALYKQGRNLLLQARLPEAEGVFAAFLKDFAGHELADNARHWLATSLAGQGKHEAAAEQFLLAYEAARDGPKAPDNLLKLGKAFVALDKPDEACTALSLLARNHKQAPAAVTAAAAAERRRLNC